MDQQSKKVTSSPPPPPPPPPQSKEGKLHSTTKKNGLGYYFEWRKKSSLSAKCGDDFCQQFLSPPLQSALENQSRILTKYCGVIHIIDKSYPKYIIHFYGDLADRRTSLIKTEVGGNGQYFARKQSLQRYELYIYTISHKSGKGFRR